MGATQTNNSRIIPIAEAEALLSSELEVLQKYYNKPNIDFQEIFESFFGNLPIQIIPFFTKSIGKNYYFNQKFEYHDLIYLIAIIKYGTLEQKAKFMFNGLRKFNKIDIVSIEDLLKLGRILEISNENLVWLNKNCPREMKEEEFTKIFIAKYKENYMFCWFDYVMKDYKNLSLTQISKIENIKISKWIHENFPSDSQNLLIQYQILDENIAKFLKNAYLEFFNQNDKNCMADLLNKLRNFTNENFVEFLYSEISQSFYNFVKIIGFMISKKKIIETDFYEILFFMNNNDFNDIPKENCDLIEEKLLKIGIKSEQISSKLNSYKNKPFSRFEFSEFIISMSAILPKTDKLKYVPYLIFGHLPETYEFEHECINFCLKNTLDPDVF